MRRIETTPVYFAVDEGATVNFRPRRERVKSSLRVEAVLDFDERERLVGVEVLSVGADTRVDDRLNEDELNEAQRVGRTNPIPLRTRVRNWHLGVCKRCGEGNVRDGDFVVRIYGLGWWHDDCYFYLNPSFYQGMQR